MQRRFCQLLTIGALLGTSHAIATDWDSDYSEWMWGRCKNVESVFSNTDRWTDALMQHDDNDYKTRSRICTVREEVVFLPWSSDSLLRPPTPEWPVTVDPDEVPFGGNYD